MAVASPSENEKLGAGSSDGSEGIAVSVGAGGGVPSTVTAGCDPCSPKPVASWKSVVVHVYVPSLEGAVAPKLIVSLAPGQSSPAASGAAASIVDVSAFSATAHVAAEQPSAAVVVAATEVGSTTNPAGTTTCALFAVESD